MTVKAEVGDVFWEGFLLLRRGFLADIKSSRFLAKFPLGIPTRELGVSSTVSVPCAVYVIGCEIPAGFYVLLLGENSGNENMPITQEIYFTYQEVDDGV